MTHGSVLVAEALADHHVEAVLAACADWPVLALSGPPYWRPRSAAELRRKVQSMSGPALASEYNFVLRSVDGVLVGECSVHGVEYRNRVAQLGICIWDPGDRRKGYGRAGLELMKTWAIDYLGLHRLEAWVVASNSASKALIEGLGFRREGLLRSRYLAGGNWHDLIIYGLLAESRHSPE